MDWARLFGMLIIPLAIGGLLTAALLRRQLFQQRPGWAFIIGYMLTTTISFVASVPSTSPGIVPVCFLVFAISYSVRTRLLKRKQRA